MIKEIINKKEKKGYFKKISIITFLILLLCIGIIAAQTIDTNESSEGDVNSPSEGLNDENGDGSGYINGVSSEENPNEPEIGEGEEPPQEPEQPEQPQEPEEPASEEPTLPEQPETPGNEDNETNFTTPDNPPNFPGNENNTGNETNEPINNDSITGGVIIPVNPQPKPKPKEPPIQEPKLIAELFYPEKIIRGQDFEMKAIIKNIGEGSAQNVRISWEIPDGFIFVSGSTSPITNCGTMNPEDECISEITLQTSFSTTLGINEIKVLGNYEDE